MKVNQVRLAVSSASLRLKPTILILLLGFLYMHRRPSCRFVKVVFHCVMTICWPRPRLSWAASSRTLELQQTTLLLMPLHYWRRALMLCSETPGCISVSSTVVCDRMELSVSRGAREDCYHHWQLALYFPQLGLNSDA